jgi:predicted transcriptional regulator
MLDIAKATEVLEDYFENVTQEQFALDLRRFCPELFEQLLQKGFSIEEIAEILELDKSLIAQ